VLASVFAGLVAQVYDLLGYGPCRKFALELLRARHLEPMHIAYSEVYPEHRVRELFERMEHDKGWQTSEHPSRVGILEQTATRCTVGLFVPNAGGDAHTQLLTATGPTAHAAKLTLMEDALNRVYNTALEEQCMPNFFMEMRNPNLDLAHRQTMERFWKS
jgi:hypothetical protein